MTGQPRDRQMAYFHMLTRAEQCAAIRRLSASRMSDYGIATATALSVGMVRLILGEHPARQGSK